MYVNFEIAALFPSPYSRVKKCGNFKINIHLDSVESLLYYLSSSIPKVTVANMARFWTSLMEVAKNGKFGPNVRKYSLILQKYIKSDHLPSISAKQAK